MNYKEKLTEAASFIKEHDDFLVLAHLHPDGDAIGSTIAMAHLLNYLGKTFVTANEGDSPTRFSYLSGYHDIINLSSVRLSRKFNVVITVDVAAEDRIGEVGTIIHEKRALLNIDHHPTNTSFGDVNVIQPEAASTTQMIYDLVVQEFPDALSHDMAEALYTGLLTDTGGFRHSNTTRSVFDMASHLLSYSVKPDLIAEYALETISPSHLSVLRKSLQNLTFALDKKVAVITVCREEMEACGASKDDVDGLVSYPRNIEGVEVGALLKQWTEGEVKVSLRSKRTVNVADIAKANGGGGHAKAAGYTFKGSVAEAKKALLKQLEKEFGDQE